MTHEVDTLFSIFPTISLIVTGFCEKGKKQNYEMLEEDHKLNDIYKTASSSNLLMAIARRAVVDQLPPALSKERLPLALRRKHNHISKSQW